ncbi:hypothetical protein CANCADRAFT_127761 [Tortispora caseinolytica NRRL Y-17796]|uniref:Thymidylate kinase n=1 Tax=Tortispora caseinolytica NRRL Y-17796 TaxID=767744 RepID=A0A1E4TAD4_9ASCO|nr:hypothetical protein CANCADRAFT_127761 [Tortispora caseinolytica NRRL Y-17796]
MRGALIVIEGPDRAGKSTQCANMLEYLSATARSPQLVKFPVRSTTIGKMINTYLSDPSVALSDQSIHLLFSANRWELVEEVNSLLDSGKTVLLDRYIFSGIAYSAAKGLDPAWCAACDRGLPMPDLTLFIDVDPETAAARGNYGKERYEKLEFQKKVMSQFHKLLDQETSTISAVVNGADEPHKVFEAIKPHIDNLFNSSKLSAPVKHF